MMMTGMCAVALADLISRHNSRPSAPDNNTSIKITDGWAVSSFCKASSRLPAVTTSKPWRSSVAFIKSRMSGSSSIKKIFAITLAQTSLEINGSAAPNGVEIREKTGPYLCYMQRFFSILAGSFRIAVLELWKAKLRTFLSLFGITIGIFCIIGVLTTVGSLERNLQSEIRSLGNNTIYVDKWQYSAGADYPFWKYIKRPPPRYDEVEAILQRTTTAKHAAFKISTQGNVEGGQNVADRIRLYGVSEAFTSIQPVEIRYGRFLSGAEFNRGQNRVVLGYTLAERLFSDPTLALQQVVTLKGQKAVVVGVMKKRGTQLIGGWGFDESVLLPYKFGRTLMNEARADPLILVQGKDGISTKLLQDELKGVMRAVRRLGPKEDDNFSLNDVNDFTDVMSKAFVSVNLGGWIIGALSFIVGIFGVANIMFVTVAERRPQIGLKKALGARRRLILLEFLLEAAFLCIIGGLIGLALVFVLTQVATALLSFPIFLSPPIIAIALFICIAAGIIAGIVPAAQAARLDPVVAIRS